MGKLNGSGVSMEAPHELFVTASRFYLVVRAVAMDHM